MISVVRILSSFKDLHQEGVARNNYVKQLTADLCSYFGYNEFYIDMVLQVYPDNYVSFNHMNFCIILIVRWFWQMFPPAEALELLEANETPRPICLRSNTLKV